MRINQKLNTKIMNLIKRAYIILLLTLAFSTLKAQTISNIQPKLVGNKMHISYKISGAKFDQKFDVSLYVSIDDGKSWQGPMTLIEGKEKVVSSGKNQMVWNIFKDLNSLDKELMFDIRAKVIKEKVEKHFFLQYSASALLSSTDYIMPLGFRLGKLGKTGWYIAGYANSFTKASYSYSDGALKELIFYNFKGKNKYPRMAITGGLIFQVGWQEYLYMGAGYGTKRYFTQIDELNPDGSLKTEGQWANISEFDELGVEIEVGAIFNFDRLNLSFGISVFDFKQVGANVGIGINF